MSRDKVIAQLDKFEQDISEADLIPHRQVHAVLLAHPHLKDSVQLWKGKAKDAYTELLNKH